MTRTDFTKKPKIAKQFANLILGVQKFSEDKMASLEESKQER
jgi:hypothetical protein